jgi:peroxiredoxin-like protein
VFGLLSDELRGSAMGRLVTDRPHPGAAGEGVPVAAPSNLSGSPPRNGGEALGTDFREQRQRSPKTHTLEVRGTWIGELQGAGHIEIRSDNGRFSVPAELGGRGIGTNPEELLAAAAATCYLITLALHLKVHGVAVHGLHIRTRATFDVSAAPVILAVRHFPTVKMSEGERERRIETLGKCFAEAEAACMVAKALRGSVETSVEPTITVV